MQLTPMFDTAVFNAQVPKEGPRALPVSADFSAASSYDVNLLLTQAGHYQGQVQAIFVDNSSNSEQVEITSSVLNQTLKIPANCQAYLPFLVPKNATVTIASDGSATVLVIFLNVPVAAAVWGVAGDLT